PAVMLVVPVDPLNRIDRFIDGLNSKQPVPAGDDFRKSGVLRDHRLAARQIRYVALAGPAASQADVLILGHAKLGARAAKIFRIGAEDVERQFKRRARLPAERLDSRALLLVSK